MNKQHILLFCGLFALVFTLVSCKAEGVDDLPEEGRPASLTLGFNLGTFPVETITRSEIYAVEENKVHNLYVLVFNADGTPDTRRFFVYDQLQNKQEGAAVTSGNVALETTSGAKTIYAIANIDDKQPIGNISRDMLDAVADKEALENLLVSLKEGLETVTRTDGKMLMSGKLDATLNKGAANNASINLRRVCAKVKFSIQTAAGISFTPKSWQVLHVPRKVRLIENTASPDGGVTADSDFFDTPARGFEDGGSSFVYYQYENRKNPKKTIPGSGIEAYALRQKQKKIPSGGSGVSNGDYEYADKNATAIVIKGIYEKKESNGMSTTANVTYTIHLGYINNNANDFHALRNTYYQYTLTVNGVDNIVLEANATDPGVEPAPGVEGQVMRPGLIYSFDAHYAQFVVEIPRAIVTFPESPKPYHVHTPFEDHHGETDINWVKFFKNGVADSHKIAAFPGEQSPLLMNVDQMIHQVREKHKENAPNYFVTNSEGWECAYFTVFVNEYYYERNPMSSTAPVESQLWQRFVDKPDREMFIGTQTQTSPDGKSVLSSRGILIRQKSITTTYDLERSTTAAGFEILDENFGNDYTDDRGLNHGNNSRTDGWANSVHDWYLIPWTGTPPANPRDEALWTTTNNASRKWDNFVNVLSHVAPTPATAPYGWGTYLLTGTPQHMQGGTNKARIACLARNRDLNGDGIVDKNEVRWYLPAIEQLVNMWIGGGNTELHEQMYQSPAYHTALTSARVGSAHGDRALYLSSSASINVPGITNTDERSNPWVLWADEGASIGKLRDGVSAAGGRKLFYTRCVRNLGHTDPSVQPDAFSIHIATERTISLVDPSITSHVSRESFRDTKIEYFTGEYPLHNERNQANLPAGKFQYAKNLLWGGKTYTWTYLRGNPTERCGEYHEDAGATDKGTWRLPNQRELLLMWRYDVIGDKTVWCSTESKYVSTPNIRYAYAARNDIVFRLDIKNNAYVRCVRDVK